MEKKNFSFTTPVLKKGKKRWYFEWYFITCGKRFRRKLCAGINRFDTDEQREAFAATWISRFNGLSYEQATAEKQVRIGMFPSKVRAYIEQNRTRWKKKTMLGYYSNLKVACRWFHSQKVSYPFEKMTAADASAFFDYLRNERHAGTTTHNTYRATLYKLFKDWKVKSNPIEDIRRYADSKRPQKAFTPLQRRALSEYIREHDPLLSLFIGFMYYTFLRPNEIKLMKVKDVDLLMRRSFVPAENSKTNRNRHHAIPHAFVEQLQFLRSCNPEWYVFGFEHVPGPEPIGRDRFARRHRKVLDVFGYSAHYSLYSWRHTGAVDFYNRCKDIYLVMQAMGHTNVEMTRKYLRNFNALDDPRLYERDVM